MWGGPCFSASWAEGGPECWAVSSADCGGCFCVHSDPTGLQETTCQQSFCLMVLALGELGTCLRISNKYFWRSRGLGTAPG